VRETYDRLSAVVFANVESSGVKLGLGVGSSARNDSTFDTKSGTVSSHVTGYNGNLSMGGDKRRNSQDRGNDNGD